MGIKSQRLALHLKGQYDPRVVGCCTRNTAVLGQAWDKGFASGNHPKLPAVRVKPGTMETRPLQLCVALCLHFQGPCLAGGKLQSTMAPLGTSDPTGQDSTPPQDGPHFTLQVLAGIGALDRFV
ncbi:mCG56655, isoform CRA_b [Mus musculus]|nr:mCG56655, isoform CRA_b [Mus musculus]